MNYFYALAGLMAAQIVCFIASFIYRKPWLIALGGTLGFAFSGLLGWMFYVFSQETVDVIIQIIMVLQRRGGV